MSDFKANLKALKEEMEEEQSGPYHQRPSCRMFVRWVTLAGGTVRGVKRRGGSNGAIHFKNILYCFLYVNWPGEGGVMLHGDALDWCAVSCLLWGRAIFEVKST